MIKEKRYDEFLILRAWHIRPLQPQSQCKQIASHESRYNFNEQ